MFFHTANSPPALCTPAYALSLAVLNVHTGAQKRVRRVPNGTECAHWRPKTCMARTGMDSTYTKTGKNVRGQYRGGEMPGRSRA